MVGISEVGLVSIDIFYSYTAKLGLLGASKNETEMSLKLPEFK